MDKTVKCDHLFEEFLAVVVSRGTVCCYPLVSFNVIGDTAVAKKHFNPPADQQVAFAPGEIYTHMEVGIVDDKATPGNKTFKIAFNSPEDWVVLSGPVEVEVIVMYSTGMYSFAV